MADMTRQEVFDKVAKHLLTQNRKSEVFKERGFACRYRGPGGLKCAVGVLIADEHYSDTLEDKHVYSGTLCNALEASGVGLACIGLLSDLQTCHDDKAVQDWKEGLGIIADEHFLNAEVLNGY